MVEISLSFTVEPNPATELPAERVTDSFSFTIAPNTGTEFTIAGISFSTTVLANVLLLASYQFS